MILPEFPDLDWLKEQIRQRFQQRRAFNNMPLDTAGFPSVIINTRIKESYRPDIVGPIDEDYFYISNRFQPYTLEIESSQPVETFNIHFGEYFSDGVLSALLTPADKILNDGRQQTVQTVAFYNRLYRRDTHFNELAGTLHKSGRGKVLDRLLFEEQMTALLNYLLLQHRHVLQQVNKMPALKLSTRAKLYRRLSLVTDYIHSSGRLTIELDQLAAIACLSKYHFLRLFKQTFGISPHQYIQQVRIEKAKLLLKKSSVAVQDIADQPGFENSQSFSRLFYQRTGLYPLAYRA